jgi:hypothetical protein
VRSERLGRWVSFVLRRMPYARTPKRPSRSDLISSAPSRLTKIFARDACPEIRIGSKRKPGQQARLTARYGCSESAVASEAIVHTAANDVRLGVDAGFEGVERGGGFAFGGNGAGGFLALSRLASICDLDDILRTSCGIGGGIVGALVGGVADVPRVGPRGDHTFSSFPVLSPTRSTSTPTFSSMET